jgi:hypothetical protein
MDAAVHKMESRRFSTYSLELAWLAEELWAMTAIKKIRRWSRGRVLADWEEKATGKMIAKIHRYINKDVKPSSPRHLSILENRLPGEILLLIAEASIPNWEMRRIKYFGAIETERLASDSPIV